MNFAKPYNGPYPSYMGIKQKGLMEQSFSHFSGDECPGFLGANHGFFEILLLWSSYRVLSFWEYRPLNFLKFPVGDH